MTMRPDPDQISDVVKEFERIEFPAEAAPVDGAVAGEAEPAAEEEPPAVPAKGKAKKGVGKVGKGKGKAAGKGAKGPPLKSNTCQMHILKDMADNIIPYAMAVVSSVLRAHRGV